MTRVYFNKIELIFILQGIIISFFFGKDSKSIIITALCLIGIIMLFHLINFLISLIRNANKSSSGNHRELFKIITAKDLEALKQYLKSNDIKVNQMHKLIYYGQVTPIIYAMENEAFEIFSYLLENGYDLNAKNVGHPPLLIAAYRHNVKYIEEMLKYPLDLYITNNVQYKGNAIEIAVWRGRSKVVKALLANGMKFSLDEYKKCGYGKELLTWDNVKREIKVLLLENYVFNQKKKMFYLNELCLQKKINIPLFNSKHYFIENLLAS